MDKVNEALALAEDNAAAIRAISSSLREQISELKKRIQELENRIKN